MAEDFNSFLKNFSDIVVSEDLDSVKHNPTNYSSFSKFQEGLDRRFAQSENNKAKKEIQANLQKWDQMQPARWSGAKLTQIEGERSKNAAQEILSIITKSGKVSLYIQGDSGSGKTYIAYATLRRYIGHGWVSPSQIKIISEEFLVGLAESGFEGRARFEELFDSKITTYLFDGVFSRSPRPPVKVDHFWEQLIDHIYNKSLTVLFTSNAPLREVVFLSDSGASKFNNLIENREIKIQSSEHTSQDYDNPIDQEIRSSRAR
jgi:DNA replication protein DnaC